MRKATTRLGRPPLHAVPMAARISVRATKTEREEWTRQARSQELSLPNWIRKVCNKSVEKVHRKAKS